MSFHDIYSQLDWYKIQTEIMQKSTLDVERALDRLVPNSLEDFKALVSPAAAPYLEAMASKSRSMTRRRFGNIMQMYIPLYISNECINSCKYCGFSRKNKFPRVSLSLEEVIEEAEAIKNMGFEHVLLVSGEKGKEDFQFIRKCIEALQSRFANISIEVPPLEISEYQLLIKEGLHSVYIYQETYGPNYAYYHPAGQKRDLKYRLLTPDRLGQAGINKIGLGFLIGLEDWRNEAVFLAAHLLYLNKNYWKTKTSISFPRLRSAFGEFQPNYEITDSELVQLVCAFRLLDENVELSLSTRETQVFRDNAFQLGFTAMSAGSKTNPGAYSLFHDNQDQFQIEDQRSAAEVASMISDSGYEPVWKDWFEGGL